MQVFFGAGGEKPEPFYRTFSTEILEAALKASPNPHSMYWIWMKIGSFAYPLNFLNYIQTSRDKLENFFERQDQGPFLKASKEKIEAMSSHEEGGGGGGIWPFGGYSKGTFNLFRKRRPSQSNKYGQLFEVDANEFKPLKDLDLRVSYANITKVISPSFLCTQIENESITSLIYS